MFPVHFDNCGLDIQKNAFSPVGTKVRNEMPNSFKNISKKTLRRNLKELNYRH